MSASVSNANDIGVTDLENDHVFVIHPKLKKESSQSSQTFETEVGGSSQSIDRNHSPTQHDIELSIIRNVISTSSDNHDAHVLVLHPKTRNRQGSSQSLPSFEDGTSNPAHTDIGMSDMQDAEPSDHTSCQLAVVKCLRQVQLFFTIEDNEVFNWTIIQTWYNMTFLQCAVPFYIRRSKESGEYEKVSFWPQQVVWMLSTALLVLEMLSWIPRFLNSLDEEPNPYVYLRMLSFLSVILLRCCFLKLLCCNGKQAIDYLNTNLLLLNIIPEDRRWRNKSRTMMMATSLSVVILNMTSVVLGLIIKAYVATAEWGWSGTVFLYTYACYGKQLLWIGNTTCMGEEEVTGLSLNDVLLGIFGLVSCANCLINLNNALLAILSCTSTLFLAVYSIRNVQSVTTLDKYNVLKNIADKLSKIVGTVLTVYMLYFAISMPDWIRLAFQDHKIMVVTVAYQVLLLLTTMFLGCVATLQIDQLKSLVTGPEGVAELPNELKTFISIFQSLFHHSVGIGYPGLFVINFRLLFSYLGIICSVIVVIHETMKDLQKDT